MPRGIYIARLDNVSISASRTLVQLNVASTCAAIMQSAYVDITSTTSTNIRLQLIKRTTAGTGTSFTPVKISGHPTALSTATNNHTAEGTAGDVLWERTINYIPGMDRILIPELRPELAPSERIGLFLPAAPGAAVNISAGIEWLEIG